MLPPRFFIRKSVIRVSAPVLNTAECSVHVTIFVPDFGEPGFPLGEPADTPFVRNRCPKAQKMSCTIQWRGEIGIGIGRESVIAWRGDCVGGMWNR